MMKKFYLVFAGLLAFSLQLKAQCADVTLSSQADVDSFTATYGCTTITRQLTISGNDITNLNGLAGLTSVASLVIQANPNLTSLHGLKLTTAGFVFINSNASLTSLDGLDSLKTIGTGGCFGCSYNGLAITDNPVLQNLDELHSLTSIGGTFTIANNTQLRDIDGLDQLTYIGNNSTFNGGSIDINTNTALVSIEGLKNVTTIKGGISIVGNPSLTNLKGLEKITDITKGGLGIYDNDALVDISALRNVTKVSQYFTITGNDALPNLNGLQNLKQVYNGGPNAFIRITDNASLTNVDSLSFLTSIGGPTIELTVTNNPLLTRGCGLYPVLKSKDGFQCEHCSSIKVNISGNGAGVTKESILADGACEGAIPPDVTCSGDIKLLSQADVDEFPSTHGCNIVTGMLLISGSDIDNLDSLGSLKSAGVLILDGNTILNDLWGLRNLETVGGYNACQCLSNGLQISNNPALQSFQGLRSLTSVKGDFKILGNQSLNDINWLTSLNEVGSNPNTRANISIDVEDNPSLTFLWSFNNIDTIPGQVIIRNNDALITLGGLKTTKAILGGMYIDNNDALRDVNGLDSLTLIRSGLAIDNNASLQSLDGLRSLTTITGVPGASMRISNNTSLTNVDSLSSLVNFGGFGRQLTVTGNTSLTRGCGFYNLVSINFCDECPNGTVTFSGNGAAFTREGIIAEGPCGGNSNPGLLMFSNVTDNSMDVSFHPNANRAGYITLMRAFESALPDEAPQNGTTYAIGNVIGCCSIVVGMGMDSVLNIVYLEPDIEYYFDVIPYSVNNGSYTYDVHLEVSGHQRTLPHVQPYPNPFVEEVTIPFTINEEGSNVHIIILDQLGRAVSEVVNDRYTKGKHEVRWSRNDLQGNRVQNGIYMYSITTNDSEPVKGLFVAK